MKLIIFGPACILIGVVIGNLAPRFPELSQGQLSTMESPSSRLDTGSQQLPQVELRREACGEAMKGHEYLWTAAQKIEKSPESTNVQPFAAQIVESSEVSAVSQTVRDVEKVNVIAAGRSSNSGCSSTIAEIQEARFTDAMIKLDVTNFYAIANIDDYLVEIGFFDLPESRKQEILAKIAHFEDIGLVPPSLLRE